MRVASLTVLMYAASRLIELNFDSDQKETENGGAENVWTNACTRPLPSVDDLSLFNHIRLIKLYMHFISPALVE